MRPVSQAFLDACTSAHTVASRVDVLQDRQLVIEGLPLIGGTVTLNRTAEIRGQCTVTIGTLDDGTLPRDLIPEGAHDPLAPFGAELQIFSGVTLSTGPELVSLGIFGIQDSKVSDNGGSIELTGLDRAQLVKDADFEATYVIQAGSNYGVAIMGLINDGVPGLTYNFAGTSAVTALLVYSDDSNEGRWPAAQKLAAQIGCDLYFDADGVCVLEPVPLPTSDPVVALSDGPGGVVVSAGKAWSRTPSYNRVIAYSTDPAAGSVPVRAVATDGDPTSATYYGGDFGKKPL